VQGLLDRQVARFAMVGVVNTVFAFALFAGLQLTIGGRVHYLVVLVMSHIVSVLEAYVLQRWLVFRVSGRWWRDLARFWSVYLVALAVNLVALPLLVEIGHIPVLPAQAMVMAGVALGSYVAHRAFTFRHSQGGAPADADAVSSTDAGAVSSTDAGAAPMSPTSLSPPEGRT
jgi:putative flippase GtrA